MEKAIQHQAANLSFWETYARWYEQWLAHNRYHEKILKLVTSLARPAWHVLDIGAGSGVLSLPLRKKGCHVTAVEPSGAMRDLLWKNMDACRVVGIQTDGRPWEEIPTEAYNTSDIILACNSLHCCRVGFLSALEKVFLARPQWVVVVTEFFSPDIRIPVARKGYSMQYARIEKVKSSYAYHDAQEALAHWSVLQGRVPSEKEKKEIRRNLSCEGEHLWAEDEAYVGIFCWKGVCRE